MFPADDDRVMWALRLGWCVAESRGRNRPEGPPGANVQMPDHHDHALPLRIERSATEQRIEAQAVVTGLAVKLEVDKQPNGDSYGAALDNQAKVLTGAKAPRAAPSLKQALLVLQDAVARSDAADQKLATALQAAPTTPPPAADQPPAPNPEVEAAANAVAEARAQNEAAQREAVVCLQQGAEDQQVAAQGAQKAATARHATAADMPTSTPEQAAASAAAKKAAEADQAAANVAQEAVGVLQQALGAVQVAASLDDAVEAVTEASAKLQGMVKGPWSDLSDLFWHFDAHVQDRLTSTSDTQACAYQLGRGLAESYWALNPTDTESGSTSWTFVLGDSRCFELTRLLGRLSAYMGPYTSTAVAGSLEAWRTVAAEPAWRSQPDPMTAAVKLYDQTRRWYELIILRQDPTTLIKPGMLIRNFSVLRRALRLFWPQLLATTVGAVGLGTLVVFLGTGTGAAWIKTIAGVVAAGGLSTAGITGKLKNSAQAMSKRLRQDAYTQLIAVAICVVPERPADHEKKVQEAVGRRRLTMATPN